MTQVRPSAQLVLFRAVLDHLEGRADLINRVVEVDLDDATRSRLTPNERLTDADWNAIEASITPVVVERDLP